MYKRQVVNSYFKLNPEKTLKDLEELMRELKLNSGIIANPIEDANLQRLIAENKVVIIQPKYLHHYTLPIRKEDICTEHLSRYYLNLSCRKREDVIKEMSRFSTVEENLVKLEETGILISITGESEIKESLNMTKVKQDDFRKQIETGTIRLHMKSYSDILMSAMQTYPKSKLTVIEENDNFKIQALVYEEKIICPVAYLEKPSMIGTSLELIKLPLFTINKK